MKPRKKVRRKDIILQAIRILKKNDLKQFGFWWRKPSKKNIGVLVVVK